MIDTKDNHIGKIDANYVVVEQAATGVIIQFIYKGEVTLSFVVDTATVGKLHNGLSEYINELFSKYG